MRSIASPRRSHPGRALALLGAAIILVAAASCHRRSDYPIGVVADFQIRCMRQLWPGSPGAPYDLREVYCMCVLQKAERKWNVAQFDRIRWELEEGGTRALPPEFVAIMRECKSDLQKGRLAVDR